MLAGDRLHRRRKYHRRISTQLDFWRLWRSILGRLCQLRRLASMEFSTPETRAGCGFEAWMHICSSTPP